MEKLRIVFMGTPEFGVKTLESLIEKYNVVGVVCQPDKEVGRNHELIACPVKKCAIKHNIQVFQPIKIRNDYQNIVDLKPDLIVTAAYGQIVNMELLDAPKYRSINLHGSLLPKYRGGSPVQEAILRGDKETGISIMYMEKGMDTGDILGVAKVNIDEEDTAGTLFEKLSIVGRDLVLEVIPKLISGQIKPIKQDDTLATYCYNIKKEDEILDFSVNATTLHNKVRAYNPSPIACMILDGEIVKVSKTKVSEQTHNQETGKIIILNKKSFGITCGDNTILEILELTPAGKKLMKASDYINGGLKKHLK